MTTRSGVLRRRMIVAATALLIASAVGPFVAPAALAPLAAQPAHAASPPNSAEAASDALEATYEVDLRLAWGTGRVRLATAIALRNTSADPVTRVVLNTVAAKLGFMRRLRVSVDGAPVPARVRGQTLRVRLPASLPADGSALVEVSFRARLRDTFKGRDFMWSRVGGVAQMYRFIPWLSRGIPFGPALHGEPFLTPVSPRVRVTVHSDRRLVWATSGRRVAGEGRRARFVARDVRDFNIAASPGFRTRSGDSADGRVRIIVYTRRLDGRRLLRLAATELARFQHQTGSRYPYPTYSVAETASGLPMESPALTWIPGFRSAAELPFLVSHETAHQWFYAIVGNDQANDAFADEALAEYFSRKARGALRASRCGIDRLDRSIQRYSRRCYYEVIYIQGARFLDDLRRRFGDGRFKRAIRAYAHDYRLGLGGNERLLEAFRAEMGDRVLKRFRARFPSIY